MSREVGSAAVIRESEGSPRRPAPRAAGSRHPLVGPCAYKDFVIATHGGLDRRNRLSGVRAHLLRGGVPWPLKSQDEALNPSVEKAAVTHD